MAGLFRPPQYAGDVRLSRLQGHLKGCFSLAIRCPNIRSAFEQELDSGDTIPIRRPDERGRPERRIRQIHVGTRVTQCAQYVHALWTLHGYGVHEGREHIDVYSVYVGSICRKKTNQGRSLCIHSGSKGGIPISGLRVDVRAGMD